MMTLADYAPEGARVHLFAEYQGRRFYIESGDSFPAIEDAARLLKVTMRRAAFFMVDRVGSYSINGDAAAFQAAYRMQEESQRD